MKWIALSILISSIMFSYVYLILNEYEYKANNDGHTIVINKWNGKQCIFFPIRNERQLRELKNSSKYKVEICPINNGKIELP